MKKIQARINELLLWSQKYTKADMRYLASGGFWLSFSQVANTLISFGLMVAFANLLSKEMFGIYRYILSIAAILNIFTLGGMQTAVTQAVATGNDGALVHAVKYQLRWNIMMILAFFAVAGFYFVKGDMLFALSFVILGIFTPATFAFNTYGAYLAGKKEFRFSNISSVLSTLVYAVGMLVTLLLTKEIGWLIVAYSVTTFISSLFCYLYTLRAFKPTHTELDPGMISYARTLSFIGLIAPIASQIDKIVLVQFWGPAQLATYSLAMAVPGRAIPFLKKFVNLGLPKFAEKSVDELNAIFYRRIVQGAFVGIVAAAVYILVAPFLFKYLLPQYLDGIFYSQILAISFIFAMPTRYVGLLFQAQKMSRQIFINTLTSSGVAIALYIVLGIYGGVLGLVIAYVLWSFIMLFVNMITWRRTSASNR